MSTAAALELNPDEFYRTDDMALVTWLKMEGHTPQHVSWEHQTCYWYFDKSDPLLSVVDIFVTGAAKVEPREYNRIYSQTKREFYDIADAQGPQARRR